MPAKLLLADDSVTVQRVIELTFADEGIQVISVSDGLAAIERAEQEWPDIVLADVSMPGLDGYAVAARLKNTPHLAHIRVVLMTGAFEQIDEPRAREAGADGVLAKPFEPQMVISLVRQLLNREGGDFIVAAPPAIVVGPAVPPPDPNASGSLDSFLEQLDEALSAATAPGGARPAAPRAPVSDALSAQPPAPAPSSSTVSLADAFSALLADELGEKPLPPSWEKVAGAAHTATSDAAGSHDTAPHAASGPVVRQSLIDEVTRRVVEQLTNTPVLREMMSQHVIAVAERLVREEIERIKNEIRTT